LRPVPARGSRIRSPRTVVVVGGRVELGAGSAAGSREVRVGSGAVVGMEVGAGTVGGGATAPWPRSPPGHPRPVTVTGIQRSWTTSGR
jgi:hypothetical protein